MTYQVTTLPSGLRVASEHLAGMESVTVAVTVDVGARHETLEENGLSHVLEHMAFKGTKRRSAKDIAEEMDMIGGNVNAYTSMENTVYYARVLKDNMDVAVDILADIIQHSTFDEQELARERDVILQEIAMHQDTPDDLVFDIFTDTAYPDQALGRSILGTTERVSNFRQQHVIHYQQKHYRAPNIIVSAAGNVNHQHFVALIGEHFNTLPPSAHGAVEQGNYIGGKKQVRRALEQLHVMVGMEAISFHHEDYYAWQLLATILGGSMSSRLFQEVREKRGLAYTIQAFVSAYADTGLLGIYAATSEEKAQDTLSVIEDEVGNLAHTLSEIELLRAKNQMKASLLMSRESSASIAEWIGRHLLNYNHYKTAAEITATIDAVTTTDIARIAQGLNSAKKQTLTMLGPQKKIF